MPYWFDGNNLIGQSAAAARSAPSTRKAFLSTLSSLRKSGGGRFTVFFDGDDPDRAAAPPGVAVRYCAPYSADDFMTRRLREIERPAEVIVVTNDRELAARCRLQGAGTLTWDEFISRMRTRAARPPRVTAPEKPVDIDEWVKFFNLDKTKI